MGDRITLSSAESALVEQIFKKNDTQGFGVITGDVAVSVFGGSKLPSTVLGEIWSLADNDNKGFLDTVDLWEMPNDPEYSDAFLDRCFKADPFKQDKVRSSISFTLILADE